MITFFPKPVRKSFPDNHIYALKFNLFITLIRTFKNKQMQKSKTVTGIIQNKKLIRGLF